MKKYKMLIITALLLLMTISSFIYENAGLARVDVKYPQINITSNKYGQILNVIFPSLDDQHIIFLAKSKSGKDGKSLSCLYLANIETEEVKELYQFETHKFLQSYLQYDFMMDFLYAASPQGIHKINLENDFNISSDFFEMVDFEDADNMYIMRNIYYTKAIDNLLYAQEIPSKGTYVFNPTSQQSKVKTYPKAIDRIIGAAPGNPSVYYTRQDRNGINAYCADMENGHAGIRQTLLKRKIINIKPELRVGSDLIFLCDKGGSYGIYIGDRYITDIFANTDLLGQVPDIELSETNGGHTIIYTQYDENHKGTIFMDRGSGKPEELVHEISVTGPLRLSSGENRILFFTKEDGKDRVKLFDMEIRSTKDITEMFN